jgi:hypothetical protein
MQHEDHIGMNHLSCGELTSLFSILDGREGRWSVVNATQGVQSNVDNLAAEEDSLSLQQLTDIEE